MNWREFIHAISQTVYATGSGRLIVCSYAKDVGGRIIVVVSARLGESNLIVFYAWSAESKFSINSDWQEGGHAARCRPWRRLIQSANSN